MSNDAQWIAWLETLAWDCYDSIKSKIDLPPDDEILLEVSKRTTSTAGRGGEKYGGYYIQLSLPLFKKVVHDRVKDLGETVEQAAQHFVKDTVIHEWCHVSQRLRGDTGHSKYFYSLVRKAGGVPARCHNYGKADKYK